MGENFVMFLLTHANAVYACQCLLRMLNSSIYLICILLQLSDKFTTVSQTFTAIPTHVPETMFELEEVQESYVLAQLQTLKINKTIGLDKIGARLLKCASCSIRKSVTRLLNLSIKSNHFPKIWKCAKVTALFKSGERSNPTNYCPISVLPTLSKKTHDQPTI